MLISVLESNLSCQEQSQPAITPLYQQFIRPSHDTLGHNMSLVLKISSKDKAAIQQQAKQERLSLSAYVRRSLCSNTGLYEDGE